MITTTHLAKFHLSALITGHYKSNKSHDAPTLNIRKIFSWETHLR